MCDFEKILLHCIIYYNSKRIVENFPYTEDMIAAEVKPYAADIWKWGKAQVDLVNHIETVAKNAVGHTDVNIKNIRSTRNREKDKNHRDYMKGESSCE